MVEVRLDIANPKRWKATGEYRVARDNEPYFGANGYVFRGKTEDPVIIAAEAEPVRESRWRPVYSPTNYHQSLEEAVAGYRNCEHFERIDYEDGKPVRMELDPAPPLTQ